jgi:hypothetical protein
MVAANSLTAAAASIVGHRVQTTSLDSTSATTTYHRMTVDGVGVFYREASEERAGDRAPAWLPLFLARVRYAHPLARHTLSPDSAGFSRIRSE